MFDIVGADEEDVAEEEGISLCIGEFNFIALAYNGWRRWGGDLITTCSDDLLCLLDLDDDDDDVFDDVYDDWWLSLESDKNMVLLAMSAVQEFIIIGFDDTYADS